MLNEMYNEKQKAFKLNLKKYNKPMIGGLNGSLKRNTGKGI